MSTTAEYYVEFRSTTPGSAWLLLSAVAYATEEMAILAIGHRRRMTVFEPIKVEYRVVETHKTPTTYKDGDDRDTAYRNAAGHLCAGGLVFDARGCSIKLLTGNHDDNLDAAVYSDGWSICDDIAFNQHRVVGKRGTTPDHALREYKKAALCRLLAAEAHVMRLRAAYDHVCAPKGTEAGHDDSTQS